MSREAVIFAVYLWLFWASGMLFGLGVARYARKYRAPRRWVKSCEARTRVY